MLQEDLNIKMYCRQFFQCLLDNADAGLVMADREGKIFAVNGKAEELSGKMLGKAYKKGKELVSHFNGRNAEIIREGLKRALESGTPETILLTSETGAFFPVMTTIRPVTDQKSGVIGCMITQEVAGEENAGQETGTPVENEQKADRQLLEKSQGLLNGMQQIMENSLDVICIIDEAGRFVQVSNTCEKVWGYSPEEMTGKPFATFVHPDDLAKTMEVSGKIMSGILIKEFENRYRRKDGSWIPIIWSAVWSPEERVMYGVGRDGTEKRMNMERLIEYEKKLNRFLESTQEGIFTLDTAYNFDLINPVAKRYLELFNSRVVQPGDNLLETLPAGRREVVREMYQAVLEGNVLDYEIAYDTKQGKIWLSVHIDPLWDGERVVGLLVTTRDITKRKEVEDALRKSEEKYRFLLENMREGIQIISPDWRYLFVNNSVVQQARLTKEDLLGHTMMEKYPGIENTPLFKVLRKCMKKRTPEILENEFIYPDGTKGCYKLSIQPVPEGLFILSMDISERKKAEEELITSNERFNLAAEASFDVIYDMNLETNTVDISNAITGLLGYSPGKNFDVYEMRKRIHPEDKETYLANLAKFLKSRKRYFVHELRFIKTDGSVVHAIIKALVKRRPGGVAYRMVGVVRDVTEQKLAEKALKESEEKYRTLFKAMPLPAWVVDSETYALLTVNYKAVEQYGYSRDEFLKMTAKDLLPPSELEKHAARIAAEKEPFSGSYGYWKIKKKDGSLADVEVTAHTIRYNEKTGLFVVANDITEKLKAENEIREINEELHILSGHLQNIREEERINIAREIHDELGQQLTGIKMDMYRLSKKLPADDAASPEKAKTIIALVDEAVKTVRRIASNLRPSILDEFGLVAALEWHSQEMERRTELKISFTCNRELKVPAGVATGLFRIYQEALTNTVRHAHAREINGSLEVRESQLVLKIKDDGQGMDLAKASSKKTLGLIGIKERAFLLGGTFDLKSRPGQGTEITVSVPL